MIHSRGRPALFVAALCLAVFLLFFPLFEAQTAAPLETTRAAQGHEAQATPAMPATPGTPTAPVATPDATATVDRLAPPPTVENPSQADEGAQIFWLNCQPCHGDVGQGLTDEWREQYPEDHQNCWTSGCHGARPYENGFTIPTYVPPVTGEGSLERFDHMGLVYSYISATMPYNLPGVLDEESYLALTAFLAREHGIWDGQPVQPDNVARLRLRPAPAPSATPATVDGPLTNEEPSQAPEESAAERSPLLPILLSLPLIALALLLWQWRRRQQGSG